MEAAIKHYKLVFFVPESHKEMVKHALFEAGAGQYEAYDRCCWETLGNGQFRPLENSQPFIGQTNKIETVSEYRVEMLCRQAIIKQALKALLTAHPYQTPAYDVWPIYTLDDF